MKNALSAIAPPALPRLQLRAWWGAVTRPEWRFVLALFCSWRAIFSIGALLGGRLSQSKPQIPPETLGRFHFHATGPQYYLLGVWQRVDSAWFETIATDGYQHNDRAAAFLPLHPALTRIAGYVFHGNYALSGLVVASIAYVAALLGLYRLVADEWDDAVARRTLLYLSIFPSAYYFFAPYAEAVFFATIIWSIRLARQGHWASGWGMACLAAITRPPGFLLMFPLGWEAFLQWRAGRRSWTAMLPTCLPPLCFLAYSQIVDYFTGWSYVEAVQTWGGRAVPPWTAFQRSWAFIVETADVVELLNLGLTIFVIVVTLCGIRRIPATYTIFALAQLIPIAAREQAYTPLFSAVRYLVVIFPFFLLLALFLQHSRGRHLAWVGLSVFLLFGLFTLYLMPKIIA